MRSKRGELDTLIVKNASATAEISLFGAQVLSFIPEHDKRERLWLSPLAKLDRSIPIRGGIPICWPWFGRPPSQLTEKIRLLPSHGFVRNQECNLVSAEEVNSRLDQIIFEPQQYLFPELELNLTLQILIGVGETLSIELITRNSNLNTTQYYAALHSYFQVESIENIVLSGLQSDYFDQTQSMKRISAKNPYQIKGETDRIHLDPGCAVNIVAPSFKTLIKSLGNDSIVVWNPWQRLSQSMPDMSDEGYTTMLCIETARTQIGDLKSFQSHALKQIIY